MSIDGSAVWCRDPEAVVGAVTRDVPRLRARDAKCAAVRLDPATLTSGAVAIFWAVAREELDRHSAIRRAGSAAKFSWTAARARTARCRAAGGAIRAADVARAIVPRGDRHVISSAVRAAAIAADAIAVIALLAWIDLAIPANGRVRGSGAHAGYAGTDAACTQGAQSLSCSSGSRHHDRVPARKAGTTSVKSDDANAPRCTLATQVGAFR